MNSTKERKEKGMVIRQAKTFVADEVKGVIASGNIKRILKEHPELNIHVLYADVLEGLGRKIAAFNRLLNAIEVDPSNINLIERTATLGNQIGKQKVTLQVCERALESGIISAKVYVEKARAEIYFKLLVCAKQSLNCARKLDPSIPAGTLSTYKKLLKDDFKYGQY